MRYQRRRGGGRGGEGRRGGEAIQAFTHYGNSQTISQPGNKHRHITQSVRVKQHQVGLFILGNDAKIHCIIIGDYFNED